MIRITRRMAQDELDVVEQSSRLAMFHQIKDLIKLSKNISKKFEKQQIKPYLNHQPDAKQHWAWNCGHAQLHNESTMEMREREILFRTGSEAEAARRHQRDHMLTEHNQLVLEWQEVSKRPFIRHQMDYEQRNVHLAS